MKEDKQLICNSLCRTLQKTRAGEDIDSLLYHGPDEAVYIMYRTRLVVKVNVACDSGMAMIKDTMENIHY